MELEQFELAGALGRGGQEAKLLQGVGEQESRGFDVEEFDALLGEFGEQVDDVEVDEQSVDERDDGAEHLGFARGVGHVALLRISVCVKGESAVEDVAGDVCGAAAGGVGVGSQSHQGFGGIDVELGDEHAGGLADFDAGQCVEFGPGVAVGVVCGGLEVGVEEVEKGDAGDLGGGDGAREAVAIEVAGVFAEEVEGADVLAGEDDGHGVDTADVLGEQGGAEGGPPAIVGVGEVDDDDGGAAGDGVEAGAFAEGELEFVVGAAGAPLEPRVPAAPPSKMREMAAASMSSRKTQASQRLSAASTPRRPSTASRRWSAIATSNRSAGFGWRHIPSLL